MELHSAMVLRSVVRLGSLEFIGPRPLPDCGLPSMTPTHILSGSYLPPAHFLCLKRHCGVGGRLGGRVGGRAWFKEEEVRIWEFGS
jgi:hypothetical protein